MDQNDYGVAFLIGYFQGAGSLSREQATRFMAIQGESEIEEVNKTPLNDFIKKHYPEVYEKFV